MTNPSTDLVLVGEQSLTEPSIMTDQELDVAIKDATDGLITSWRHSLEWGWRLGQCLTEKKTRLGHGNWLPYVEAELPFQHDQATRLMDFGKSDYAFMRNLPAGTSVTEAVKQWQRSTRSPRPVRVVGTDVDGEASRRPLPTFCGPDWSTGAIVREMVLTFFSDACMALDVTYGNGNFWSEGAPIPVTGHDSKIERAPDGVMDFTDLQYDDATWDLVLFDPSQIADASADSVMGERFGSATQEQIDNAIIDGTREAWRVCSKGIIVKVCSHVHAELYQDEELLVGEALDWKIPLYQRVYQVREGHGLNDPDRIDWYSALNNGATYLVYRKGDQRHRARKPS